METGRKLAPRELQKRRGARRLQVLASAVGGWDPEYLAEDWHMFAKCSLMTEGRARWDSQLPRAFCIVICY